MRVFATGRSAGSGSFGIDTVFCIMCDVIFDWAACFVVVLLGSLTVQSMGWGRGCAASVGFDRVLITSEARVLICFVR